MALIATKLYLLNYHNNVYTYCNFVCIKNSYFNNEKIQNYVSWHVYILGSSKSLIASLH